MYILSIVFQIAGAIILLLDSLTNIEEQICRIYFEKDTSNVVDNNCMISLNKEKVKDIAKGIILNRCAFVDLIIGYLAAIFAEKNINNNEAVIIIAFFAILIIAIEFSISEEMSKKQAKKDMKVHATNSWGALLLCNIVDVDSKNLCFEA